MPQKRLVLSNILNSIPGIKKVYYSPPSNTELEYPCAIYRLENYDNTYANNNRYITRYKFRVTIIDTDPDSRIPEELMAASKYCSPGTNYVTDGLYHFPFTITI